MKNCYRCPAYEFEKSRSAYSTCAKCILNVPEIYADSLTGTGCTLSPREIAKMLKALKGRESADRAAAEAAMGKDEEKA